MFRRISLFAIASLTSLGLMGGGCPDQNPASDVRGNYQLSWDNLLEPLDELFIERKRQRQHLDCDLAVELSFPCPVDDCHPATPQFLDDLVLIAQGFLRQIELGQIA